MNPLEWPPFRFDLYPGPCRPSGVVEALGNAGGFSGASLWRFEAARGPLVLRRWPTVGPDRTQIAQIHAWLAEAGDLGFVPVPIATLDGRTIVEDGGRLWELAPWLPGSADLAVPPNQEHLRLIFSSLAAFHARLGSSPSAGPSPGLEARAVELDRLILGEFGQLRAAIERRSTDPAAPLARNWLDRAIRGAGRVLVETRQAAARILPLQPCLRDARPDHFLLENHRLTGLVDFGAMGRESVAADLARLLGESVGADRLARLEALLAYESTRPLAAVEARTIEPFERANALLGPARWVRWHFIEARAFDQPDAAVIGLRRGLARLGHSGF